MPWPGLLSRHVQSLLPSQCTACRAWPAAAVCGDCTARFSPATIRCHLCAIDLPPDLSGGVRTGAPVCGECLLRKPPVDASLVAVSYGYPWATLISRYKFGERPGWAGFFAGLLAALPEVRHTLAALEAGDWILPLPLSAQRLENRGFNQAWELASALSSRSLHRGSADARLLLRIRDTRPQTELRREARIANVRDAFTVDPLRAHLLRGRRVVLVDDVMTSGASLFAAAEALRAAGAAHITAVAFARTAAR
ncbi:MAG: ComF family protein [Comamonadaceae bacterium]|nr:MAG: ComF family protein [Comamonadaceae bacterium]